MGDGRGIIIKLKVYMKKELGKLLLDLAKIIFGGAILTRVVKNNQYNDGLIIPIFVVAMMVIVVTGLVLIKKSEQ